MSGTVIDEGLAFDGIAGMGRPLRTTAGGLVYHLLNRANARMQIFDNEKDYDAFERILDEAAERVRMRLLAYCVMPNHWHLVVWPRENGDLSIFCRRDPSRFLDRGSGYRPSMSWDVSSSLAFRMRLRNSESETSLSKLRNATSPGTSFLLMFILA